MQGEGGQNDPLDKDKALIPSIFIKTSQFFLVKADINRHFLRLLATFLNILGMIIIAIGGAENDYLFFGRRIIKRNATKSYDQINKKNRFGRSFTKRNLRKFW